MCTASALDFITAYDYLHHWHTGYVRGKESALALVHIEYVMFLRWTKVERTIIYDSGTLIN